ncbi:MAG: leucyl aminopeptidase [Myxococcota bacterium]|nr:leucyl aminopeptidase [Myxococcota bacterium]
MQVSFVAGSIEKVKADFVAAGVYQGDKKVELGHLEARANGTLKTLGTNAKRSNFDGKIGQKYQCTLLNGEGSQDFLLLGMGQREKVTAQSLTNLAADAVKQAQSVGASNAILVLPELGEDGAKVVEDLARGASLGTYKYDVYRSEKDKSKGLKKLVVAVTTEVDAKTKKSVAQGMSRGQKVAAGVALARNLVNEPPSDLYPETFAKQAENMAKAEGLKCKVYKPAELKKMKMNLLLGVGQGSAQTPRLVHLTYTPASAKDAKKAPIVLVGKGITFDSGGLCLKPAGSMSGMKMDMGGAAAVMGAMLAVARSKPKIPVHGILALAENMPSGTAIRLDDVIKGASGKTVEVNNTDAEGRLVLADALHYATGLKPRYIVDLATLTGACMVALGPHTVGLFSNDDDLANSLLNSSDGAGEHFWRLPLTERLREQLKSDVADMKNTGERFGGAITAALFLKEFVGDNAWAHLDIAGAAMTTSESGASTKGGSGVAVATLVDWIQGMPSSK